MITDYNSDLFIIIKYTKNLHVSLSKFKVFSFKFDNLLATNKFRAISKEEEYLRFTYII